MTIWKYRIIEDGISIIRMPLGAEIISTGLDPNGDLCVWAIVDDTADVFENVEIRAWGTGWHVDFEGRFIGTVKSGIYMWHVFEVNGRHLVK